MATKGQIKKIHTLKTILGLDEELYRELLISFDSLSSKDLTFQEACIFIDYLEEKAIGLGVWKKPSKKYADLSNRAEMATPAQLRKIEVIWKEFLKIAKNLKEVQNEQSKKSLRRLLQRQYHVSDLRFLPKSKVSKVIKTIETMINQQLTAS